MEANPTDIREYKDTYNTINMQSDRVKEHSNLTNIQEESDLIGNIRILSERRIRGPSNCVLVLTYFLIVVPSLIYSIFVVPFYGTLEMVMIYITFCITLILCLWTLYDVSSTDPGFLKHGNYPKEEFMRNEHKLVIKGQTIELKYCGTCKIVRPPRSFHCSTCGNCVDVHDHHCPFVGNCIGEKNIGKFFLFLLFICLHCINVAIPAIYIYFMRRSQNKTYEYRDVIDIVVIAISIIFGITMFVMVIQHIYLISTGKTTNEFIRNRYNEKIFSQGCCNNWKNALYGNKNTLIQMNLENNIESNHQSQV